jgi:cytochrome b pre-mRNA-processing protein 3
MILKRIFQRTRPPERSVYESIVAAARHPVFYTDWQVADTLDGRFDMIALHAFLVLDRLKGQAGVFRQNLVDELFRDMDRSLREMGVGDLSVGKKVRKMAEVFYGRIAAYDQAAAGKDSYAAVIARNVFPEGAPDGIADRIAVYVETQRRHLATLPADDIVKGRVTFQEPSP